MEKIAVYGSLCQGFFNYEKYLLGHVAYRESGYFYGSLYHLHSHGYPALLSGKDQIYCEIMTLQGGTQAIMAAVHKMEGADMPNPRDNEYHYRVQPVFNLYTGLVEQLGTYVYNMQCADVNIDDMEYIAHGNWPKYMREKEYIQ